jgi:WD40 repeat protein
VWEVRSGTLSRSIRAQVVREHEVHTIERDGVVIKKLDRVRDIPSKIATIDVSEDNAIVAAVSANNTVSISSLATGDVLRKLPAESSVTGAYFLTDNKTLATVHAWRNEGTKPFSFWKFATGTETGQLSSKGDAIGIGVVAISKDRKIIAGTMGHSALFADATIRLWSMTDRRQLPSIVPLESDGFGCALALSPTGDRLAVVSETNRLVVWDVATRARAAELELGKPDTPTQLSAVRYSSDGNKIAVLANEYRRVGNGHYEGVRQRLVIVDVLARSN